MGYDKWEGWVGVCGCEGGVMVGRERQGRQAYAPRNTSMQPCVMLSTSTLDFTQTYLSSPPQDLESRKRAPLYQKKQEEELKAAVDKAQECEIRATEAELKFKEAKVGRAVVS